MTLIIIVPMFFLPNTIGLYIRDPKEITQEQSQELIIWKFDQRTFSAIMIFVIEGFYYFFLIATLFPGIFLIIWSTLAKWREGHPIHGKMSLNEIKKDDKIIKKRKKFFSLTRSDRDYLPMGLYKETEFPINLTEDLTKFNDYPDISLIIPCYNEEQNVAQAIENAYLQDYPGKMEIIVVDDGSRDNTRAICEILKENGKDRKIIALHKSNGGKASAINLGLDHAKGKIIITTDGDSHFNRDCVSSIIHEFKRHPKAGIIGGFVLIRNTEKGYLVKLQQMEYILTQHAVRIPQSEMGNVLIEPGPVFGIRADVAKRYPCLTRTCCEDVDLTQTVLGCGYPTRTALGAVSLTNAPTTWRQWYNQRKRWIYGQYQSWRENKHFLKRNLWGLYMYFTWLSSFITLCILITLMVVTFILLPMLYFNQYLFVFISVRTVLIVLIYLIVRVIVLYQYKEGKSVILYLPFKVIYDLLNSLLSAVLYFRFVTGLGVKIRWGEKTIKLR